MDIQCLIFEYLPNLYQMHTEYAPNIYSSSREENHYSYSNIKYSPPNIWIVESICVTLVSERERRDIIGPIEVHALPLGRCRQNIVATINSVFFFSFFFLSPLPSIYFFPEGVFIGLWNFARGFKSQKRRFPMKCVLFPKAVAGRT